MGKLIALEHLTLDGVMQGPARPDEDTRDGFTFGGWAVATADPAMTRDVGRSTTQRGGLLLGRRTYLNFFEVWPKRGDNPFTNTLTNQQKYVVSTTLAEPLPWVNSTLLRGNAAEAVARLKQELDGDLLVMGSGELLRSLMPHHLVDEYRLIIHPLVLGGGQRLFDQGVPCARLQLVESEVTKTGAILATYRETVQR